MADHKHPTWGMISLHRTSGHANLFRSAIKAHNFFTLTVRRASMPDDMNRDFVMPREELIQVSMTANQLSEMLFNMGTSGVPCTIDRATVGGEYQSMGRCPPESTVRELAEKDLKERLEKLTKQLHELRDEAYNQSIEKNVGKHKRAELAKQIDNIITEVESNIPFMFNIFNERVEKVVTDAKGEITASAMALAERLGVKALIDLSKDPQMKALDGPKPEDESA